MKIYLIVAVCLISILAGTDARGSSGITLPNLQVIGSNLKECVCFFDRNSNSKGGYPVHLVVDTDKDGKVTGLAVMYDKSVTFSEVESSINKLYGEHQTMSNKSKEHPMTLWRVTSIKVSIQLCLNELDMVQIIVIPVKKWKSPQDKKEENL
jgi:hypothetical protein